MAGAVGSAGGLSHLGPLVIDAHDLILKATGIVAGLRDDRIPFALFEFDHIHDRGILGRISSGLVLCVGV